MTWASISLRKMELKNKINTMESQLIDISKQLQKVSSENSAKESEISLWNNYNLSGINSQYTTNMQLAQSTNWSALNAINSCTTIKGLKAYIEEYNKTAATAIDVKLLDGYPVEDTEDDITDPTQLAAAKTALLAAVPGATTFETGAALNTTDGMVFGNVSVNSSYYAANAASTIQYNAQKLALETQTNARSSVIKTETEAQTQTLEAQQEALQTQIKAARAEYDSLGDAMDNDISKGAIKLI